MTGRAIATVDLVAIRRNAAVLRSHLAPKVRLCAVVKADAYGHGALPCARAALAGGATWLAVATAAEAAQLRSSGLDEPILVMGALSDEELTLALQARADVVAWREEFVAVVAGTGLPARIHVKFDSGMGRLGTRDPGEVRRVAAAVAATPGLELAGAMTHFATADERDDPFFSEQLARFTPLAAELRAAHPGLVVHAANSAATLRDPAAHFDMVRCGIAVYGMDPYGDDPATHGLEPALELRSYVAAVKPIGAGESAGYGRRYIATAPTTVATVPIGYGDGLRRALTNNAEVLIGGRRHPVVGAVSMDNITLDVGADATVAVGRPVTLIGREGAERILAEEMARRLGSINYEVTTGLLPRVTRVHRPAEGD
jgi:alanine racemase